LARRQIGSNCVSKMTLRAQRYAKCKKKSGITRCARSGQAGHLFRFFLAPRTARLSKLRPTNLELSTRYLLDNTHIFILCYTVQNPRRSRPSRGVYISGEEPTAVFLTVCTRDRKPWLACDVANRLLRRVWTQKKDWIVAEYVLLPDHLHLFAYPAGGKLPFDAWVKAWKSLFSRTAKSPDWRWQSTCFRHRIRNWENAESKIHYIKGNPVRLGLIERAEDWPFAGRLSECKSFGRWTAGWLSKPRAAADLLAPESCLLYS
jgi:REP element-mobilizing transposase RayT